MSDKPDNHIEVDVTDPCTCEGASDKEGVVVNYDLLWGDAHVIHDPERGGCGKFMRHWSRD